VPCLLEATTPNRPLPNRPLPNRPLPIDQSQAIDLKRIYSSSDFAPPSFYRTMARHPNPFLGVSRPVRGTNAIGIIRFARGD